MCFLNITEQPVDAHLRFEVTASHFGYNFGTGDGIARASFSSLSALFFGKGTGGDGRTKKGELHCAEIFKNDGELMAN